MLHMVATYASQHGQTTRLWLNILTVGRAQLLVLTGSYLFTTTATMTARGASVVQREKT